MNYGNNLSLIKKRVICLILTITLVLGLATAPAFAAAENTEYENALKSGWGNSIGGYTNPSGYSTSWNMQVLRFLNSEYNTLGTLSTLLNNIHTETNYIPTINTALNSLKSGWGNWSSGYTYPSGYGSSWYRLMFEGVNYISGTLERIEQIESDSAISNIADILYDNATGYKIKINKRTLNSGNTPGSAPTVAEYDPLNVTYVTTDTENGVNTIHSFGTGAPRSIYSMLGFTNTNIVSLFSAMQTIGTQYRNLRNDFNDGIPQFGTEGQDYVRSYSIADQLHNMAYNDTYYQSKVGYILSHLFDHNISGITSAYFKTGLTSSTSPFSSSGILETENIDILKPLFINWRNQDRIGTYSIDDTISNATLSDYIAVINSNIVNGISSIYSPNRYYQTFSFNTNTLARQSWQATSIADMVYGIGNTVSFALNRFMLLYADNDTLAAKQANANQEQTVLTNFTGSGSASAGASDFVAVKDSLSSLKSAVSGSGSYTNAFNVLSGSSDGWSWFSTENANAMDTTSSGYRSGVRSNPCDYSNYPLLAAYYSELYNNIGVNVVE